jgi:hypothetical protein
MTDDDATSDGLPRFIYGEHTGEFTGEFRMPTQPDDEAPAGGMDRKSIFLLAGGGLALVLIIGLVIAALSTGGPEPTPAAANPESPAASSSTAAQPSPTDGPPPTTSWPTVTDNFPAGQPSTTTKPGATKTTTKPGTPTTKPTTQTTTRKPPKPSFPGHL